MVVGEAVEEECQCLVLIGSRINQRAIGRHRHHYLRPRPPEAILRGHTHHQTIQQNHLRGVIIGGKSS